jgi:hypothetical protein
LTHIRKCRLNISADSNGIVSDASLLREESEGAVMVAEAKALFIEPTFCRKRQSQRKISHPTLNPSLSTLNLDRLRAQHIHPVGKSRFSESLLTVLFDEVFARCVSAVLPSGLGMTANLNVDFRKPALPDRMYHSSLQKAAKSKEDKSSDPQPKPFDPQP